MSLSFPFSKSSILGALLRNESGGRNVANTHQGTSSGQAQGFFQITTGTWDDFGGRKYAPTPMGATYEQQADIAKNIPLKRWDQSTLAAMRATGRQIDPNRTLGDNLAMHQESFNAGAPAAPQQGPTQSGATLDYGHPQQGPTGTGATLDTAMNPPPPPGLFASNELKPEDQKKGLGGLLGELQKQQAAKTMEPMVLQPGGAGAGGAQPSLSALIQQYMTSQMRGGPVPGAPVQTPPQGGFGLG